MDRRSSGRVGRWSCSRPEGVLLAALLLVVVVGCARQAPPAQQPTAGKTATKTRITTCGTSRTAANVPVDVEIAQGHVSCGTAMAIEQDYAQAIRSGKAPGNGGGGPVRVKGWTCEGFATPVVLKTGKASRCVRDGDEILAVLPLPA